MGITVAFYSTGDPTRAYAHYGHHTGSMTKDQLFHQHALFATGHHPSYTLHAIDVHDAARQLAALAQHHSIDRVVFVGHAAGAAGDYTFSGHLENVHGNNVYTPSGPDAVLTPDKVENFVREAHLPQEHPIGFEFRNCFSADGYPSYIQLVDQRLHHAGMLHHSVSGAYGEYHANFHVDSHGVAGVGPHDIPPLSQPIHYVDHSHSSDPLFNALPSHHAAYGIAAAGHDNDTFDDIADLDLDDYY
jgi:hypothetical protein